MYIFVPKNSTLVFNNNIIHSLTLHIHQYQLKSHDNLLHMLIFLSLVKFKSYSLNLIIYSQFHTHIFDHVAREQINWAQFVDQFRCSDCAKHSESTVISLSIDKLFPCLKMPFTYSMCLHCPKTHVLNHFFQYLITFKVRLYLFYAHSV